MIANQKDCGKSISTPWILSNIIEQGFFLGGLGVPQGGKNVAPPDRPTAVPAFWPVCPPSEFCPWKFQKFYLIFLSILTTFQLKTASESSILLLKTPKFALILL